MEKCEAYEMGLVEKSPLGEGKAIFCAIRKCPYDNLSETTRICLSKGQVEKRGLLRLDNLLNQKVAKNST